MKTITTSLVLGLGLLTASGVSQAALISEDNGLLVDDTTLNITWLADANLAASNTFGVSGILSNGNMSWATAQTWIAAMNSADYQGYSNWRLPTADATCNGGSGGPSCTGSEMGELFYNELGGTAGTDIVSSHNPSLALFNNVNSDVYWSGLEYTPGSLAWDFYFSTGNQGMDSEASNLFVWAVHSDNPTVVPLPAATWLFGSGLLGLIGFARRNQAST